MYIFRFLMTLKSRKTSLWLTLVFLVHQANCVLPPRNPANKPETGPNIRSQQQHPHHHNHQHLLPSPPPPPSPSPSSSFRHLNYYHRYHSSSKDVARHCLCLQNTRRQLCGSPSCPCRKYSGDTCVQKMCSCLKYANCRSFYHPQNGFSCPCFGNFSGFNCSTVDHRPTCVKTLYLEATDSLDEQKLFCFPQNGSTPVRSPCFDPDDDLVYSLPHSRNDSHVIFSLRRPDGNGTCLWFQRRDRDYLYTVKMVATEKSDFYSRPERSDTFEVQIKVKANLTKPTSIENVFRTFIQYNFQNHPFHKGFNLSLTDIGNKWTENRKVNYEIIEILPNSFSKFVHLDVLAGNLFVSKPNNSTKTRQILSIRVKAMDETNNTAVVIHTKLNLIISSPLCQTLKPIWLYTTVKYEHSVMANLYCSENTGIGPFSFFFVQTKHSGLTFTTNGSEVILTGNPPYQEGMNFLKLNVQDRFGDLGTTIIPYVIAPSPELQVLILNSTSCKVTWHFSPIEPIKSLVLKMFGFQHKLSLPLPVSTQIQLIKDLYPFKNYSFQILAEVGDNQTTVVPSNVFWITTPGNVVQKCHSFTHWNFQSEEECLDMSISEIFSKLRQMNSAKFFHPKQASVLLESLDLITSQKGSLEDPKSLETGTEALKEFSEICKFYRNQISQKEATNFYHTASNLLSSQHKELWDNLNQKSYGVPKLMKVIEDFGKNFVNNFDNLIQEPNFAMENLEVQIGRAEAADLIFPNPGLKRNSRPRKTNVVIFAKTLKTLLSVNETVGYTVTLYKTLAELINSKSVFSKTNNQTLNTDVLGVTLSTKLPAYLDPPIQLTFQHVKKNLSKPECSFWDFNSNLSSIGFWSTNGCHLKATDDDKTICLCDHLTNFAVLMFPVEIDNFHSQVLTHITIIGCSFSILGSLLTLMTYAYLWRFIHRHRTIVLIHLCISLIIADLIFLAGIEQTTSKLWCTTIAVMLHYFYLVVFFNMLAEGLDMALSVIYVFSKKSRTCYLISMAWGLPAVIVGITMATTKLEGYGNPRFCWLSLEQGIIWAFVAPAALILAINLVIIVLVFRALCSTTNMSRKSTEEKAKSGVRGTCVLLPVLGLTWFFGIFSVNKETVVFQYLFALFNSLQGLLIFVFHCVLNKQISDAFWKRTNELSPNSRTNSRSSPRFYETAKRQLAGGGGGGGEGGHPSPKNVKGLVEPCTDNKLGTVWSTAGHKPVKQCLSIQTVLHYPMNSDPRFYSQKRSTPPTRRSTHCVKGQELKTFGMNEKKE